MEAPVAVPGTAEQRAVFVGFAHHSENVRVAVDWRDERCVAKLAELQSERFELINSQCLVAKGENAVFCKCSLDRSGDFTGEGLA